MDGKPRKAKTQQNCYAWWYSDRPTRIDIYIRTEPNGPTVTASITRRQLEAYLNRCKGLTCRSAPK